MTIAFVHREAFKGHLKYNPFFFGMNFNKEPASNDYFHIKSIDVFLQSTALPVMKSELTPTDMMHEFLRFNRIFNSEGYNECNNIGYNRFKVRTPINFLNGRPFCSNRRLFWPIFCFHFQYYCLNLIDLLFYSLVVSSRPGTLQHRRLI